MSSASLGLKPVCLQFPGLKNTKYYQVQVCSKAGEENFLAYDIVSSLDLDLKPLVRLLIQAKAFRQLSKHKLSLGYVDTIPNTVSPYLQDIFSAFNDVQCQPICLRIQLLSGSLHWSSPQGLSE